MVNLIKMFSTVFRVVKVLISSITWYLFYNNEDSLVSDSSSEDELPSGSESTDEPSLLSIFVNEALLPKAPSHSLSFPHDGFQQFERTFMVDGIGVQESEGVERLRKFEVYSVGDMEQYSDDIDMSVSEERPLEIYIENVPNGVIINSNVFLNYHNWNTLVFVSETTFTCAVCGVYCDEEHDEEHIKLDSHIINMSKHKPLYQYDLSIVRKINDYYHCGVCNLLFRVTQDEHFTSETHGEKMLSALNKVSDIMYDSNTHNVKTDTYHYSAKAINNNNLDLTSSEEDEDNESEYNDNGNSYGDLKYVENYDDEDDEDFYDNVEPPLSLEHSYASMARKPKTDDLPKVLEIDLGNKKVTVNYNSWNMVINPKLNRFYCMVCTTFGHVRVQAEHCRSLDHVERLARCRVVDMYEMYLVRQVDDKLYHCGHCNNLQLIHEMEDHIESQHPANRQTHVDSPIRTPSTPLKNYPKTKPNITNNDKENSKNGINNSTIKNGTHSQPNKNNTNINIPKNQTGDGNLNMYHDLRLANSNINENLVICAYGRTVKISKMAYNIVCTRANDFYCGLCEVSVARESIKLHVNDLQHLILLQRTPFIEAFNIHLFRQIRDALHCALCNELIQLIPAIIISHKFEPKHVKCLQEASDQVANEKVPTAVKSAEKPASINTGNNIVKEATFLSNIKTAATTSNEKVNNAAKNITNNKATQNNVKNPVKFEKLHNNAVTLPQKEMEINNAVNGKTEPDLETSTEFIEVKNGVKEDLDDDSDNLDDSLAEEFDFEEYVYVKLGNVFIKITNTAYNTLVEVGDGTKYCFVCAFVVDRELKKHIESRGHMENMEKCKFVDKYKEDLLRQIYLMYHCSICNVLVTRKQLNQHLSWPTHVLQTENTKISGKQRKTDIKSGMKQYVISTVNENIYLNETETKVKVHLNVLMQKENVVSVVRKNKIIIFNDNVLKISFDAWHSLSEVPVGWKCKVCQCEFDAKEIATHVASDWHIGNLEKFEKKYSPALVRKINDATLNCVMCNTEVSNKKQIALEHIQGKKHKKSFDAILEESSVANSYADCDEDVLTL